MIKYYTGIGSRETPQEVLTVMTDVAKVLRQAGYTLRSGGAEGADTAFHRGSWDGEFSIAEVYLPWPGFNGWEDIEFAEKPKLWRPIPEAYEIAAKYHPGWKYLSKGGRALHARNVHQVLGSDVDSYVLSEFIVCWTPKGKGGGGTGQAIRVAKGYGVPVHDLGDPESHVEHLPEILSRYF